MGSQLRVQAKFGKILPKASVGTVFAESGTETGADLAADLLPFWGRLSATLSEMEKWWRPLRLSCLAAILLCGVSALYLRPKRRQQSSTAGLAGLRAPLLAPLLSLNSVGGNALECGELLPREIAMEDGSVREYMLYVPPSLCNSDHEGQQKGNRGGVPLVVYLHCFGCECGMDSGWETLADTGQFIVLKPCGVQSSWNAGACCGAARAQQLDDVGFVERATRAVISASSSWSSSSSSSSSSSPPPSSLSSAQSSAQSPPPWRPVRRVDPARVYVTGWSNGGYLTTILARKSTLFAAAAPVSGYEYDPSEATARPDVRMLINHGLLDNYVQPRGCCGQFRCCCDITSGDRCTSVADFFAKWGRINKCSGSSGGSSTDSSIGSSTGSSTGSSAGFNSGLGPAMSTALLGSSDLIAELQRQYYRPPPATAGRPPMCQTLPAPSATAAAAAAARCSAPQVTLCLHPDNGHTNLLKNPARGDLAPHIWAWIVRGAPEFTVEVANGTSSSWSLSSPSSLTTNQTAAGG